MKNKILLSTFLIASLFFAFSAYATNQNGNPDSGTGNQIQQQTQTENQGEETQIQVQTQQQTQDQDGSGQQTQNQNQVQNQGEENQIKNSQNQNEQGQLNAENHRSVVANFVQSLLRVANRDGGIGEQVRSIAQQQNQSASTTIQAMEKIQTRNRIKTFLIGSDYKNLGAMRSEMVQTRNRIEQLTRLENNATETDKAEIQAQIKTLEQEQARIENFIKSEEEKFSMFGWIAKLFSN